MASRFGEAGCELRAAGCKLRAASVPEVCLSVESVSEAGHITKCGFPKAEADPAHSTSVSVTPLLREGGGARAFLLMWKKSRDV